MNISDVIEKLEERAKRTPFDNEREICRRKIIELRDRAVEERKTIKENNIKESRNTFVMAFYPWYAEEIPEGFAPFLFYPYMKDVVFEKCAAALDEFPSTRKLAMKYKKLTDLISEHYRDYYYYKYNADVDYGLDYYIILPEEVVFFLSNSYDKKECIRSAFAEFEKRKETFLKSLDEGKYDDIILNLSRNPLLEME